MKFSVILLCATLFLRSLVPFIDYAVNYDYIVSELCENKDDVEMACNGKCHLMKQIVKTSEDSDSKSPLKQSSEKEVLTFYVLADFSFLRADQFFFLKKQTFRYTNLYAYSYHQNVYRPPVFIIS